MADGILCIHCGFQETEHILPEKEVSSVWNDLLPKKPVTLKYCRENFGYCPDNPELAAELQKNFEKETHEQRKRNWYRDED